MRGAFFVPPCAVAHRVIIHNTSWTTRLNKRHWDENTSNDLLYQVYGSLARRGVKVDHEPPMVNQGSFGHGT